MIESPFPHGADTDCALAWLNAFAMAPGRGHHVAIEIGVQVAALIKRTLPEPQVADVYLAIVTQVRSAGVADAAAVSISLLGVNSRRNTAKREPIDLRRAGL